MQGDNPLTLREAIRIPNVSLNHGVLTPYAGVTLGDAGNRTVRTGTRWQLGPDVVVGLEATGQTSDAAETDNQLTLRAGPTVLRGACGTKGTHPPLMSHGPRTRPHASLPSTRWPGAPGRANKG